MKNVIFVVVGLFLGSVGALAYSHYLGDGSLLADLQEKLDAANADLAKAKSDKQQLSQETTDVSDQVDQLQASNADLRKQLDAAKSGAPAPAVDAQQPNLATIAGLMMGMMRGGGPFQAQQRLFTMQKRLNLTPDQTAKIKAAMDADNRARRDLMRQRFQNGGKVDPAAAAAANTLDSTLTSVLTYQQQADYQKLQDDEKAARAETSATSQIDGVMPLLQLTDSQKESAMEALYQVQVNAPDPNSLMSDPNPIATLSTQAQSTQAALAKVLTSDQMTLYQQQSQQAAQAMAAFGQGRRGGFGGGNGGQGNGPGGNGNGPGGNPQGGTPASTANAAPAVATPAATPATNADGTVAAPAATTNAAPSQ